jgi:NAD(P)H-flavin reductase
VVNSFFTAGLPRATVSRVGQAVLVKLPIPNRMNVQAGQTVKICFPRLNYRSLFQFHPLVIASAENEDVGTNLVLIVEPRRGWTRRLMEKAGSDLPDSRELCAVIAGPYGLSVPVHNYGVVVLAASGWGLVAVLPYLQSIARGFTTFVTRCRRLHLVWQIDDIGENSDLCIHSLADEIRRRVVWGEPD